MRITGTFLDEISHDIPHQNWGEEEWRRDFAAMKAIGIDTVILIRCGHDRWMTYPSDVLAEAESCRVPPVDLVDMFLRLAEEHAMTFWFGTYDSGRYWGAGDFEREVSLGRRVIDEAWQRYGDSDAFGGWYISLEVSRRITGIIETYASLARHCKEVSGGLPTLISPYVDGPKAVRASGAALAKADPVSIDTHRAEWAEIMSGIAGAVDIVAFQDGHIDYEHLPDFLSANKQLAEASGLECWTNAESFDRDMPIKFLPIKWEKLLLKLAAAEAAGYEKALTFEFSHFMSPNSCYPQAHGLYRRYCEHFGIDPA